MVLVLRLVTLLLFCISLPAFAATYYVAVGGSGSTCSQGNPCGTILTGMQKLSAGDTLYIRGGTYDEAIRCQHAANGTSDSNRTTIAGYPGETVLLMPSFNTGDVVGCNQGTGDHGYMTFDNLIIDAINCTNAMVWLGPTAHHMRVQNSTVRNADQQGIVAYGRPDQGHTHDHEYINLDVYNHGRGRLDHGFYTCGQFTTIRDSRVHDNSGYGLQMYDTAMENCNSGTRIYNNQVYSNRGDGNVTLNHSDDLQFYNNVVFDKDNSVSVSQGVPLNVQMYNNTMDGAIITQREAHVTVRNTIMSGLNQEDNSVVIQDHNLTYTSGRFVRAESVHDHFAEGSAAREPGGAVHVVTEDVEGGSHSQGVQRVTPEGGRDGAVDPR